MSLDHRVVSEINAMITHRILNSRACLIRQGQTRYIIEAGPLANRQASDYSQSGHKPARNLLEGRALLRGEVSQQSVSGREHE